MTTDEIRNALTRLRAQRESTATREFLTRDQWLLLELADLLEDTLLALPTCGTLSEQQRAHIAGLHTILGSTQDDLRVAVVRRADTRPDRLLGYAYTPETASKLVRKRLAFGYAVLIGSRAALLHLGAISSIGGWTWRDTRGNTFRAEVAPETEPAP